MIYPDNVRHYVNKKRWRIDKTLLGVFFVVPHDPIHNNCRGGWIFESYDEANSVCESLNRGRNRSDTPCKGYEWSNKPQIGYADLVLTK